MAILSLNETTTFRWTLEDDVAQYSAAGIEAIGVWRQKLSDYGQDRAVELIRKHHLKVSHLFWAGEFTGSEGHSYRESVADTADALRTAAALEAGCLVVCSARELAIPLITLDDSSRDVYGTPTLWPRSWALSWPWSRCIWRAGQCTFLNSLDDALGIIEAIDRPQVKLLLDTYHLGQTPGLAQRIPGIVSRIALVQLGDAKRPPQGEQNRCRLGMGSFPCGRSFALVPSRIRRILRRGTTGRRHRGIGLSQLVGPCQRIVR